METAYTAKLESIQYFNGLDGLSIRPEDVLANWQTVVDTVHAHRAMQELREAVSYCKAQLQETEQTLMITVHDLGMRFYRPYEVSHYLHQLIANGRKGCAQKLATAMIAKEHATKALKAAQFSLKQASNNRPA
jgi:hypothetical protein